MKNENQVSQGTDPSQEADIDLMFRSRVYPNSSNLFALASKPIAEAKDSCVVVIDTNQLLLPYTVSQSTLTEIEKVYKLLIGKNRVVIPGQVAREFVDHRFTKIGEVLNALKSQQSQLGNIVKEPEAALRYPFLEGLAEYRAVQESLKRAKTKAVECRSAYADYNKQLGGLVDTIKGWCLNDPVSLLYRRLFASDVVVEVNCDEKDLCDEFKYKKRHKLPPGFNDKRIGDLIIWKTILSVGSQRQTDLLFVTGEEKNDWVRSAKGITIAPRFELIEEYWRVSGGKLLFILPLSQLLELFGATEQSVLEIRASDKASGEEKPKVNPTITSTTTTTTTTPAGFPQGSGSGMFPGSGSGHPAYSASPHYSFTPDSENSGSGGWEGSEFETGTGSGSGESGQLMVYWDDGDPTPLVFQNGKWIGPAARINSQGETVRVPPIEINDDALVIDGLRYPVDSRLPFFADVTHNGLRI